VGQNSSAEVRFALDVFMPTANVISNGSAQQIPPIRLSCRYRPKFSISRSKQRLPAVPPRLYTAFWRPVWNSVLLRRDRFLVQNISAAEYGSQH
jgi:hypothetical protein